MTDQELLELAAKAASIKKEEGSGLYMDCFRHFWNPLINDGDAFQLAVKLKMIIDPYFGAVAFPPSMVCVIVNEGDIYAATRKAIVQIAAELGKERNETT